MNPDGPLKLCRALILCYFISELVWTTIVAELAFFSPFATSWRWRFQSWLKPECGCGGEETLCSHKTAASCDREYVCKAGRDWW